MRKPRDFESALRALTDKTKALKENKRRQLGELIVATGADALDIEILADGLRPWPGAGMWPRRRPGASAAPRSFAAKHAPLRADLVAIQRALRRVTAARHRLQAQRARHDTRAWAVKRRERTRHLIELGGLVVKAGLVELTNDDRAMLYGAFLELAFMLQGENREQIAILWRRRGSRAFKCEKKALQRTA